MAPHTQKTCSKCRFTSWIPKALGAKVFWGHRTFRMAATEQLCAPCALRPPWAGALTPTPAAETHQVEHTETVYSLMLGRGSATGVWCLVFWNLLLLIRHQYLLGHCQHMGAARGTPGGSGSCPAAPTPTSLCFLSLRLLLPTSGSRRD